MTYTGIETISNMSEEARNPAKTVPRSTIFVIIAVLIVSACLPTIGVSVFPIHIDPTTHQFVTELGSARWRNDPVSGIVSQFHPVWLARAAGVWVSILAFTILVIASNAGLIGISRLSYSLAVHDVFPRAFANLHPRFKTPFIAIIVFGLAACVLVMSNEIEQMAAVYSLAATFAFCVAHFAVMRLRYVQPNLRRPFRMPINVRFGRSSIPVLSVIGALAIGAVFTQLMFEDVERSSLIFIAWLVAGVLAWIAYRRYRKAPLWEPLEMPPVPDRPTSGAPPPAARREVRVRVGRSTRTGVAPPPADGMHHAPAERPTLSRRGRLWQVLLTVSFCAIAALGVGIDLSPLDPLGPGLSWSPGLIVVLAIALILLFRSRAGT